jgi:hypothetical protein
MNINESDDEYNENIEMTPELLAQWAIWEKEAAEEQAIYDSYSPNAQRAIDELYQFVACKKEPKNKSLNELKDFFIKARKNNYLNKNLDHDPNITNEEFIEAMEYFDHESKIKNKKTYFNCEVNPDILYVLSRYEDRFVYKDTIYEYYDKNMKTCKMCKEKTYRIVKYDIMVGCKNEKYHWHQSIGEVVGVLE